MEQGSFLNEVTPEWLDDYTERLLRLELEQLYRFYELEQEIEDGTSTTE